MPGEKLDIRLNHQGQIESIRGNEKLEHHLDSSEKVENYIDTALTKIADDLSQDNARISYHRPALADAQIAAKELRSYGHSDQAELFDEIATTIKQIITKIQQVDDYVKRDADNEAQALSIELADLRSHLKEMLGTEDIKI